MTEGRNRIPAGDVPIGEGDGGARWLSRASALLVAAVLLFAGFDKLLHYGGFRRALESYVVVPDGAAVFLALPVILVEVGLGIGLLVPAWRRRAAGAAAGLLAVFTAVVLVNQRLAPDVPCGCTFTLTLSSGGGLHVALNLLLIAVAAGVALEASTGAAGVLRVTPGDPPDPSTKVVIAKEDP